MAESERKSNTEEVSNDASVEKELQNSAGSEIPTERHRRRWLFGGTLTASAAAVAGLVFAFVPMGNDGGDVPPGAVGVTYEVTGKGVATISYSGESASPQRVAEVHLPWTQKVQVVPQKGWARVSIVLGKDGGHAACSVAVRGKHRQRSTASGSFGRASCSAPLTTTTAVHAVDS